MPNTLLIKKEDAKKVDLKTKFIRKYNCSDKKLEINHMTITGRHPDKVQISIVAAK